MDLENSQLDMLQILRRLDSGLALKGEDMMRSLLWDGQVSLFIFHI